MCLRWSCSEFVSSLVSPCWLACLLLRRWDPCPLNRLAETAWERKRPSASTLTGLTSPYSLRTCCRESARGMNTVTHIQMCTHTHANTKSTDFTVHTTSFQNRSKLHQSLNQLQGLHYADSTAVQTANIYNDSFKTERLFFY